MKNLTIYTDGAYSSSLDQGGLGIVILFNNKKIYEYSKMYQHVTNNKMELGAVIIALKLIKGNIDTITIVSDSMYVIGCATLGWQRKKNVSLWKEFDKQFARVSKLCTSIEFKHIKGHSNNYWNEYVDKLAVTASKIYSHEEK